MSLRRSKSELRQEQSAVRQGSNLHKQRFDGTQTARLRFDAITNSGFPAMNGQRIVLPLQPPLPPFVYNMPGRYSMFLQHCGPLPPPAPLRFLLPPLGPPTAFPAIPPHRKLQFDEWHHQDALRNASMLSLAQIDGDSPILDNGITPRQSTPVHGSVAASQPIDIRRCQSPLLRSSPEETRVSAKSSIDVTVASVLNPHAVAFQPSTSCILVPVPSGPKATCLPFPVYELPAEASRPFPFIFDRVEVLQKLDFPNASNHAFYDLRWTSDDGDAAAHSEGQATPAASNISASSSQITPRRRRSLLQVQDPITGEDVIERERIQSAEMNNSSQQSFSDSFSSTTSDGSLTPVADAFGNIMKPPLCHREADRPMLSAKMGTPPSSKISSHRHSSLACSEAMPKVTSRPNGNNAVGSYGLQSARNASNRNASLASSGKQPLKGLAPERIGDITFGDFANEEVGVESSDSPNADTANTSSTDKTMIAVSSLHSPSKEAIRSDESKVLSERGLETAEVSSELQLEREDTGRCDEVLQSGSGACRMVYSREFAMALGELPCCKLKPDFLSDASRTDELAAIAVTPEERHSLLLGPQTNGCISPRKPFTFASGHSADSENDSFVPSFCKPATAEASLPSQADNDIRAVDDVNVFKVPQAPGPRNAKRRQSRSSSRSISRSPRRQPQFPAMNGQRIVLPLQPPLPPFVYNMPGRYSMFLQHCGPLPPPAPLRFLLPPLGPPTAFPAIPPHRKLQFDEWHHQDALRNASMLSLAQIDGDSPILDNGITPRQSTPVHGSVAASQPIDIRRCQSPLLRSSPEETRVSAKSSIDVTVASVLNPHAVAFQPSTSCILVPVPSGPKATCLPFPVYELPAEASRPFPFIFDRVEVLQKLDFPNASNHAFYDLRWTSDDGDAAAHSEGQATPAASNISASSSQITPRRRRSLLQVQDPITGEDVIERERIQSAEMNNSSQQSFSDSFSSTTSDGSLTPVADAFGNIMKPPLCHREADRPMLSAKMGTPPSSKISSHRHSSLACSEAMPKVTSRPNGNNAVGSYGLQSARNASNRNASLASSGKQPLKGLAPERIGDITFGDFANEEVGVESSDSPNADTANTSSTDKTMIAVSSLHSPSKEAIRSDESKVLSERGLETAEVSSELQLEREDTGRCDEVLQSGSGACRMVYSREFAMALGELPCCKLKPDFLSDASRTDELAAIAVTPEERHSLLLGPQTNGCISPRKPFTFASGHSADSENDSFVPSFCKPATAEASLPSQADNDIRAVDDVNVFKVPQAPGPRNAKRRQSRSSSRSISRSPRRQPQNEISVPDRSATDAKQPERIVIRSSINEEVKLASAGANAWVPRIKRQAESQEQQLTEEQTAQELLRKARGIFNRITPETFDELLKDFMELKIVGEESWTVVIDECFSKVVKDYKTYGQLYTRLFVKVHEPPDPSITDPKMQTTYVFFQKLITKCQSEFLEVHPKFVALEEEKQRAIDAIDSPAEKAALQTELLEMQQKERIRYTGTVMFVGELYLVKLLTATIVEHCFAVLCPPKGLEEENLQLACMLMCRIGSKFEKDKKKCVEQFQRLLELALANLEIAGVTKFHIREVIESRKKNWKSTRSLDSAEMKPQTLEQVEYALAKERAWKEEKLREYNKQMAEAATGSNRRHEASAEATPQNGGYHGVVDNSAWFAQPQRQEKCWAPRRDAADRKTTTSDSDDESGPLFERKELSKYLNGPNVSLRPEKSFNAWKMRASSKT